MLEEFAKPVLMEIAEDVLLMLKILAKYVKTVSLDI
jgi:hypothetical protein